MPRWREGQPLPSSGWCQPCCWQGWAPSQILPRSNLFSFQTGKWASYHKYAKPLWKGLGCLPALGDGLAGAKLCLCLRNKHPATVHFPWGPGPAPHLSSLYVPLSHGGGKPSPLKAWLPLVWPIRKVAPGSAPAHPVLHPHQNWMRCLDKGALGCMCAPCLDHRAPAVGGHQWVTRETNKPKSVKIKWLLIKELQRITKFLQSLNR